MIKITLLLFLIIFTGCVNKHGISAKYYSECKEYYDLQGYYHKECGEDDIITYKEATKSLLNGAKNVKNMFISKTPKPNVW